LAVQSCTFTPDCRHFVTGTVQAIDAWDGSTGELLRSFEDLPGSVSDLRYSPDGTRIAVVIGDEYGALELCAAATFESKVSMPGLLAYDPSCRFSPDGRVIVANSAGAGLHIWDAQTGQMLRSLTGQDAPELALIGDLNGSSCFSPDGRVLITCSNTAIHCWDTSTWSLIRRFGVHSQIVYACSYSRDGRRIATADADALKIWDPRTGALVRELRGHAGRVTYCAFSADDRLVVAASCGQSINVWNTHTGTQISAFVTAQGSVTAAALADTSLSIAVGDEGGEVYLLRVMGVEAGVPIATLVEVYDFEGQCWESELTARCCWCSRRIRPDHRVIQAVRAIVATVDEAASPCAALPDAAWTDQRLLTVCPICRGSLRINPFIAARMNVTGEDTRNKGSADA
jgi:WD40 repeat protein